MVIGIESVEMKTNRIDALVSILFKTNPCDFISRSGSQLWATYVHPRLGQITLHEYELFSKLKSFSCGYETLKFKAFIDAYERRVERPSFFHPILRYYYNKGLEAKRKFNSS